MTTPTQQHHFIFGCDGLEMRGAPLSIRVSWLALPAVLLGDADAEADGVSMHPGSDGGWTVVIDRRAAPDDALITLHFGPGGLEAAIQSAVVTRRVHVHVTPGAVQIGVAEEFPWTQPDPPPAGGDTSANDTGYETKILALSTAVIRGDVEAVDRLIGEVGIDPAFRRRLAESCLEDVQTMRALDPRFDALAHEAADSLGVTLPALDSEDA